MTGSDATSITLASTGSSPRNLFGVTLAPAGSDPGTNVAAVGIVGGGADEAVKGGAGELMARHDDSMTNQ